MAASGADNMQTELSADDAAPQPPYQRRPQSPANAQAAQSDDRTRRAPATASAPRVRTVRLTTQVHPDMLVPYLYGERGGGRSSINAIASSTGCAIDYCALSPDEPERSPQSRAYVMNFLVQAGSSETLEEATRQLRTLVDRVQVHLQKKARVSRPARGREDVEVDDRRTQYYEALDSGRGRRGRMSPRLSGADDAALDAASKRETVPDERWTAAGVEESEEAWDVPPMQRVYYAPGGPRVRRERPRYMEVTDVEADEKNEFLQQRGQSPSHFVARRRVRRYPDQARWIPRNYPAPVREDAYAMYAVASPRVGNEQAQRILRNRQPRHLYQEAPNHFAQSEYSPYEFEASGDEIDAEFSAYNEAVDLTNENAGANTPPEFGDVPDQHQPVHRSHPRRSLKRSLSKMRNDGPPPPPIYRQRRPYIYDYAYEDDEWMSEDEEMASAYGYPPQFRPVEIPVVRRRRRFDSVSSQQWSSPAGRGHPQMYKRRRIPPDALPLEHGVSDGSVTEAPDRDHIIPFSSRTRTALVDQLDEVAENPSTETYPKQTRDFEERAKIPSEDGSTVSSASDTNHDNAALDDGKHDNPSNETENSGEALTDSTTNRKPDSPAEDPSLEHGDSNSSCDVCQSADGKTSTSEQPQQRASIGPNSQSEVMPLDPSDEATVFVSPQRSVATTSSLTRKTPESRVASPPPSTANNVSCSVPCEAVTAMDFSARTSERTQLASGHEVPQEQASPAHASVVSKAGAFEDSGSDELHRTQLTTEVPTPVENVVTDTIRINNHVIASLERVNKAEADFVVAKASLSMQEGRFRRLENNRKCHRRLEVLCGIVYDLQCRLGSQSFGVNECHRQELLGKLDSYLENLFTESEQTLQDKVYTLQEGLEHVLASDGLTLGNRGDKHKPIAPRLDSAPMSKSWTTSPKPIEQTNDSNDDIGGMDWEGDGWFEESVPADPAIDEDQDIFVAQISPKKSNLKFEGDFLAVKLEEGTSPRWPRELPPFVWSLLARVISSDPQSYVMKVTQKRLMDEIAKGDPYYYLHPTTMSKEAGMSSPLRLSPSQPCEFGCRGASALKWERKLVSQISSRMKSFDNVAYSLARSSGGKEVLNRKKMNSIIRKLHLVAMQLHSLVSHLYCVKGQATCKEVDSLPIALNNSHFERKMGVYKSRLKLVVPHKYQQQQSQQQQTGTSEPTEELLRDTYEFFPELLLCVDIWGYNYRESQAKRLNSKSLLSDQFAGSSALFPLGFFRGVESLAFDFEHDSNGLLRCICDELLNIVCLWNDFKWTDNLEAVALDRVMSFEADVTASILKILEIYAHHLQALWAVRLLDEPEQLRNVHFTQLNAYYSDRSQGSLNKTTGPQSRTLRVTDNPGDSLNRDGITVDQLVANEIVEQRLAEEYWNRKVSALSVHNPDDDAVEMDDANPKSAQLLDAEAICSWDQQTLVSYLLRWSDVYAIRSDVNALSAVTNHMLKHEVQKYTFASRDGQGEVSKVVVDAGTRQLLAAVSRAQMLIRDALLGAEKLALHSASNRLPDERKHSTHADAELEKDEVNGVAHATRSSSNKSVEDTPSCPSTPNDAHTHAEDIVLSDSDSRARAAAESSLSNATDSNAVNAQDEGMHVDTGITPNQPELKDLIQLLAVTKQDMQDLCSHRPRSARMREKVQTQSLQLTRQTVEIFRNIRNMYGSQRR
ncbi:hypothetical protein PHYPSEUDO_012919 [Phytophthora pseudosyringae]|uniref:Uncharacterized protein n=1 Tax=Phytophthora pseudosyringae TaxID=221518 RepID=A0A8T1W4L5_9STRA|nr:hypothetical protein PHYPSEUDO_012919 [Phytophthora pseudosyringae]